MGQKKKRKKKKTYVFSFYSIKFYNQSMKNIIHIVQHMSSSFSSPLYIMYKVAILMVQGLYKTPYSECPLLLSFLIFD